RFSSARKIQIRLRVKVYKALIGFIILNTTFNIAKLYVQIKHPFLYKLRGIQRNLPVILDFDTAVLRYKCVENIYRALMNGITQGKINNVCFVVYGKHL